ncbi:hypothetical protein BDR03DRAFT_589610 [Suillus americanus]|nr:hypothetical protein BDR03DRAFT_589610 [Suillus americanus]
MRSSLLVIIAALTAVMSVSATHPAVFTEDCVEPEGSCNSTTTCCDDFACNTEIYRCILPN